MSRLNETQQKLPQPDFRYKSRLVTLLICRVLKSGKKSLAQKIVYRALKIVSTRKNKNAIFVFQKAIKNSSPKVMVKVRRVGGSNRSVPTRLRMYRSTTIALKWLTDCARVRPGKSMANKLANELMAASEGMGNAVRKKEQMYKMARSNRAFVRFTRRRPRPRPRPRPPRPPESTRRLFSGPTDRFSNRRKVRRTEPSGKLGTSGVG